MLKKPSKSGRFDEKSTIFEGFFLMRYTLCPKKIKKIIKNIQKPIEK